MKIEILGTGCRKCKALFKLVDETLKELGMTAELVKVEDIQAMMDRGVMITPALFIDGEAVSVGKVPKKEELVKILQAGARA